MKIELTNEQAEELRDLLQQEIDREEDAMSGLLAEDSDRRLGAEYISRDHRRSFLSDILELLEIA